MAEQPAFPDSVALGRLAAVHRRSALRAVGLPLLAALIPAAAAAMLYAVLRFVPPTERETLDKAWFLVAAAGIGSLVVLWSWWKSLGLSVEVFEHGFAVRQRSGVRSCRWDGMSQLWSCCFDGPAPAGGRTPRKGWTVVAHDGTKLEIPPGVARAAALLERLRTETLRWMLPWALDQFHRGGLVPFGSYTVSRQGLAVSGPQVSIAGMLLTGGAVAAGAPTQVHTVAWSEFSEVRFESRWIRLKRPGRRTDWYVVYQAVPNAHVLEALLRQILPHGG